MMEKNVTNINVKITLTYRWVNVFGFDLIFELSNRKTLAKIDSKIKNLWSANLVAR